MSAYLRQLSYRRIFLLVLAGSQLFPLPDLPVDAIPSTVALIRIYPEVAQL